MQTDSTTQLARSALSLARFLDLWGFTRKPAMQYVVLLITGSFVLLEARYNIDLLNAIIDQNATRESVGEISDRGKLLAAFGIAWAAGRALTERLRPALLGVAVFAMLSAGVYSALDYTYAKAIRDLPADVKLKGFSLFTYRSDLLTGKLSDPDIPLPQQEPVFGRLMMGAFPIVVLDQRFMLPANDIVQRKANDVVRFVLRDAEKSWPDYAKNMQELMNGYKEFQSGSKQAMAYRAAGGIEEFRRKSGGLEPDPSLTLEQFVEMLRKSPHQQGQTLREAEGRQVARRPDGKPVLAGEVPKFLQRQQFLDWFAAQAKQARDEAMPTEQTIESMIGIQEISSAVFLPPMAMIASLTSALTNGISFVLLCAGMLAARLDAAPARRAANVLHRFATPIMLALFVCLLALMPRYVFPEGPLRQLEATMHTTVGLAGTMWSRLGNLQVLLLRLKH